jgi:hypothetical protein
MSMPMATRRLAGPADDSRNDAQVSLMLREPRKCDPNDAQVSLLLDSLRHPSRSGDPRSTPSSRPAARGSADDRPTEG